SRASFARQERIQRLVRALFHELHSARQHNLTMSDEHDADGTITFEYRDESLLRQHRQYAARLAALHSAADRRDRSLCETPRRIRMVPTWELKIYDRRQDKTVRLCISLSDGAIQPTDDRARCTS